LQHDLEQFELLASELAAQLAAALQAPPRANALSAAAQHKALPGGNPVQAAAEAASAEPCLVAEVEQEQHGSAAAAAVPSAVAVLASSSGSDGLGLCSSGAELAGVLSRLMGAPLMTR
jgi:hypothetical protein